MESYEMRVEREKMWCSASAQMLIRGFYRLASLEASRCLRLVTSFWQQRGCRP